MNWNDLRAVSVWAGLPTELKSLAAQALYTRQRGGSAVRGEADGAIAQALRFREAAVRQMPVGKRVEYLARFVRPDESLASSLLMDLHLEERRPVLGAFLDVLEIPHRDGLIDEEFDLAPPPSDRLAAAVSALYDRFARDEVDLYLASLVVLDPETWSGVPDAATACRPPSPDGPPSRKPGSPPPST